MARLTEPELSERLYNYSDPLPEEAVDTLDAGPPVIVTTVPEPPGAAAGALVGRAYRSCYAEVSQILTPEMAAQVALQLTLACAPSLLAAARERDSDNAVHS